MSDLPIHDEALTAWCRKYVADLAAPIWAKLGPNPLAVGEFCGCGARLERGRACPMECE